VSFSNTSNILCCRPYQCRKTKRVNWLGAKKFCAALQQNRRFGLGSFSEMVENHWCRSKKNVNYHNILLSSQNDHTGSV